MATTSYICPCCGWNGLAVPAYRDLASFPGDERAQPPYEDCFGPASYEVCSCCGFEFGNDDNPGTAPGVTFAEHLQEWISKGARWFDGSKKPANWSLQRQLDAAGLHKGQ